MNPTELQSKANAQGRGYLSLWKARNMLATVRELRLERNRAQLRKWVANCLEMEGFDAAGVDAVTDALARER